jgi:hypothetical protein
MLMKNNDFKLYKISDTVYEIRDNKDKLALKLEGNFTKEQLQEQLNNCTPGCIII